MSEIPSAAVPVRPTLDRVLVKKITPDKITAGGLHLPDNLEDRPHMFRAEVIAVGPGRRWGNDGVLFPPNVKVGDVVLCMTNGSFPLTDGRDGVFLLDEGYIMGVCCGGK